MSLEVEISKHSQKVSTTAYSMSVGELIAMYRDGELNLHPEFQRFFRWTNEQKSCFVESLLLGIPVPPIFVSEQDDSKWDVIDGLQRLSTILELTGELKKEDGSLEPPLTLTKTKYLKELKDMKWCSPQGDIDGTSELPESARIKIKRARLDVNIVKNSSDEIAKYEIFQRLNGGGSNATDQEIRNCVLLANSPEYFNWVSELSELPEFQACIPLTDRAIDEGYATELVVRFIVLTYSSLDSLRSMSELGTYLTERSLELAKDEAFDKEAIGSAFGETFRYLNEHLGENAFRRYDTLKGKYVGPMLISLFEVVGAGLGRRYYEHQTLPESDVFCSKHKEVWAPKNAGALVKPGMTASTRIPLTIKHGRTWVME